METLILGATVVLIVLVSGLIATVWLKWRSGDASSEIKVSLREEFLSFQTNIHEELNTARTSVDSAKDVISSHAIKTISQIQEIGGTLQGLIQQQEEAQKLGQSLKDLLQAPKLRGNYSEAILEEMLDRALPKGIWERQYSIDGSERVDCVVRFKDVIIPIDAKFPRDDYMKFLEADAQEDKSTCWDAFENAVKRQVTSINAKYIKPERGTSEFALMFIPSEPIYYEMIAETNQLGRPSVILAYAQDRNVIPVSPLTLYAFLEMVVLGIRNAEVIRSARKMQEGLSNLQRSFGLFYNRYEDMGKRVTQAAEAYRVGNDHIERYKRRLDSTLRLEGYQEEEKAELPEGVEWDTTPLG